jgi:hypothetical protein
MAESKVNAGPNSCTGDSTAEEGAVSDKLNLGVTGSFPWEEMNEGSIANVGKVWLRGRWKLLAGLSASIPWFIRCSPLFPPFTDCCGIRACCDGIQDPVVPSGENANGVVGLVGPPEKEEGAVSVNALDREVVL